MKLTFVRAVAVCLLVLLSLSFSGIVYSASALMHPEIEDSCCGSADRGDGPLSCSVPDCPCFSCAILILNPPIDAEFWEFPTEFVYFQIPLLSPSDFIQSIEYPPEHA